MDNYSGSATIKKGKKTKKNKHNNGFGIVIHAGYKDRSPNKQKHWDMQEQLLSTEAVTIHIVIILLLKN